MFLPQDTGKLRIGTYTGDLQHGTVYSGGEDGLPFSFGHPHSSMHRSLQGPQTSSVTCWTSKGRRSCTSETTSLETSSNRRSVRAGRRSWWCRNSPKSWKCGTRRKVRTPGLLLRLLPDDPLVHVLTAVLILQICLRSSSVWTSSSRSSTSESSRPS